MGKILMTNYQKDNCNSLCLRIFAGKAMEIIMHVKMSPNEEYGNTRFQILMAVSTKMVALGEDAPCSLIEVYRRFSGNYCLYHQGDKLG
jgi:hypothetical protein